MCDVKEVEKLRGLIEETINLNFPEGIEYTSLRVVVLGILLVTYKNEMELFLPHMEIAKMSLDELLEKANNA